jgi:cation transport regulator ChaB
MRYETITQLPFHCQTHLPEAALEVYKDAWNRAWDESSDRMTARAHAWDAVRERFERDAMTRQWVPRAQRLVARVASANESAPAELKRSAV